MRRLFLLGATILALVALNVGSLAAADPPAPRTSPTIEPATLSDAARSAGEELKTLPSGVVQVDCRPGMATFPPFTRFSGPPGNETFFVLADGRCFRDATVRSGGEQNLIIEAGPPSGTPE